MKTWHIGMGWVFLALLVLAGWGQSIYKLTQTDFEKPYKAEIIYGVGLFPPVGMFVGWVDIPDGSASK